MSNSYDNPNNPYDPRTIRGRQRLEEKDTLETGFRIMICSLIL